MPEQHVALLGLQRLRVECQKVIAESALLLVTDQVGLQHRLAALRATPWRTPPQRQAAA